MNQNSLKNIFEFAAYLTILAIGIFLQSKILVTGDITWLMRIGEKFLQGGHYYTDFFEVNPPMCIYIYLIPVLLSKQFHLIFPTTVLIFTFIIAIISWCFSYNLLKKILINSQPFYRINLAIALAFLYFIFPSNAFGQREYLFAVLMMPYLLIAVLRAKQQTNNQWLTITAGLFAGIGFCLKPFFLMTWLFIELYLFIKSTRLLSWLRCENVAIIVVLLCYAVSIPILTPEYLTKIVPITNIFYYINYQIPLTLLLLQPIVGFSVILFVTHYFLRKKIQQMDLLNILLLATFGGLLTYLAQFTLWFYHMLPAAMFSILLGVGLASEYWQREKNLFATSLIALAILLLMATNIYMYKINFKQTREFLTDPVFNLSKKQSGKFIFIFTDDLAANYPFLDYTRTSSPSRFPSLWLMRAADKLIALKKDPNTLQTAQAAKQFVIEATTDDLIKNPPFYIFIQKNNAYYSVFHKNWISYDLVLTQQQQSISFFKQFLKDAKFQQFWQNYRYMGVTENFYIYCRHCEEAADRRGNPSFTVSWIATSLRSSQ